MQVAECQLEYLETLNAAQRQAAAYGEITDGGKFCSGPLLVIAGAGTGKTMTLAHRVAHLLISGVSPERILLLTFTRRAAQEMTRRVESIVEGCDDDGRGRQRHKHGAARGYHLPLIVLRKRAGFRWVECFNFSVFSNRHGEDR